MEDSIELILHPIGSRTTDLHTETEDRFLANGNRFTLGSSIDQGVCAKETIEKGETVNGVVTFSGGNVKRTLQRAGRLNLDFKIQGGAIFNMEWIGIPITNHN